MISSRAWAIAGQNTSTTARTYPPASASAGTGPADRVLGAAGGSSVIASGVVDTAADGVRPTQDGALDQVPAGGRGREHERQRQHEQRSPVAVLKRPSKPVAADDEQQV